MSDQQSQPLNTSQARVQALLKECEDMFRRRSDNWTLLCKGGALFYFPYFEVPQMKNKKL